MKMPNAAIRGEIEKFGAIPFARFMELALYCPESGYYERNQDTVGCRGDFITSVSTGELFGQLLAFQFGEWLENLRTFQTASEKLRIVEAGAHDGKLAEDILTWLKTNRGELFSEIEYILIEPSQRRQNWQKQRLEPFSNVRWVPSLDDFSKAVPRNTCIGILFGNELLDAFPIHRFGWDAEARNWFEWGVAFDSQKFIWCKIECSHPITDDLCPAQLRDVLPNNFVIETSPTAMNWWCQAAKIFSHGKLLAIDYGFNKENLFSPSRTNGTLRAYYKHRLMDDALANVGEQDLTAHVNFPALQAAGENAGLNTEIACTQPQFLIRILAAAVDKGCFNALDAKQVRQFHSLTHPEHLGRAFQVLVQRAG